MARQVVKCPNFITLQTIGDHIRPHLRADTAVTLQPYFFSDTIRGPMRAYISFVWSPGAGIPERIVHRPGIPLESLVPEKIEPIAAWIVRQIRGQHPEWFVD